MVTTWEQEMGRPMGCCDFLIEVWYFLTKPTFFPHVCLHRLASFYEIAVPELESAIKKRRLEDSK